MNRYNHRVNKFSPDIPYSEPLERGDVVYIPQFLCQASLPKYHSYISEWQREFYRHRFTVLAPKKFGVPGGSYSRLILIRITTLAKHSASPVIDLGSTASELMQSIGLGQRGKTIEQFKKHFLSCINCIINIEDSKGKTTVYTTQPVIEKATVTNTKWEWNSEIILSNAFFTAAKKSVPTDWGSLLCISPGTLRMDIFNFLVYRLFYLRKETLIPWKQLHAMFSSPEIPLWAFKPQFEKALTEAKAFYLAANAETIKSGLLLNKSQFLIQPIKK